MNHISRSQSVTNVQAWRKNLIIVLTMMSMVEMSAVCAGYYWPMPYWLMVANIVCVMFNFPLILWLATLYFERRAREKKDH